MQTWVDSKNDALQAAAQGDAKKAEECWINSLRFARQQNDPAVLNEVLEGLANFYLSQNKTTDAIGLLKQSLDLKEKNFGRKHIVVADHANKLASLYFKEHHYGPARYYGTISLEGFEHTYGKESPAVATMCYNLATLAHLDKKFEESETLYQRALALRTKILGSDHEDTAKVLQNYAKLLRELHREAEADHLDTCAKGAITGAWTKVEVDHSEVLGTSNDRCKFCGAPVGSNEQKCMTCGTAVGAFI
jgi:tetratricopeptide (TPR) repeat protein